MLIGTVLGLGLINTGDAAIAAEGRGQNALERGFKRTGSISAADPSLGVRMVMWKATGTMIRQRPLSGVGAGAWESEIPLYQAEGSQLETDYYVHNEFLQLLAEYGLVGWLFLLGLVAYLLTAAGRTLNGKSAEAQAEAPWRAVLLCSLLTLMIVSNVGFPWRMAATGALFALCLARVGRIGCAPGFRGAGGCGPTGLATVVFARTGRMRRRRDCPGRLHHAAGGRVRAEDRGSNQDRAHDIRVGRPQQSQVERRQG